MFVKAVPGPGEATQVSPSGGDYPVWRPDGQALYYRGPGQMLMEVPVRISGATPEIGTLVRSSG